MTTAPTTNSPDRRGLPARGVFARLLLVLCGLLALPGSAAAWWNGEWAYRKPITIDAGRAAPGATLRDVPVLIRLHEGVLDFAATAADGSDLRFVAGDDQTPLEFHIEKYDAVFNLGFVWVRLPQLAAGTPVQIWMYYGNPNAPAGPAPAGSFDAEQTLVYHFGERGTPAQDASQQRNHSASLYASADSGLIGGAARLDGQGVIALPASPALETAAGGAQTLSLWVKPATADASAVLYSRRAAGGALTLGLDAGTVYLSVQDAAGQVQELRAAGPLAASGWRHLAVVFAPQQATLYIDGRAESPLAATLPALQGAALLGGDGGIDGAPVSAGFSGEIDELRIARVARDAADIAFAAHNQGTGDASVSFGLDEQQSSFSTGYVGIILASVTIDGWVVIGSLILMMVISWYVMWVKARQIARAAKANRIFLRLFRKRGSDFAELHRMTARDANEGPLDRRERALVQHAPLRSVFEAGLEELRHRLDNGRHGRPTDTLDSLAIESIRASVDSTVVQESQALSSQMVLLTIAISGGPFIGLLGTVVGVMITFAGVAAAGDVNVNAIAPGISAALVATVAGLFVAIPALFGYNYLITRIKECNAEMQVFVDAFTTRMAEYYNSPATPHVIADY